MRFKSTDRICGRTAAELRRLFRYVDDSPFRPLLIEARLRMRALAAERLAEQLDAQGWIERIEDPLETRYRVAERGRRLALASFAPPLHRATAERKLQEMRERVHIVNHDTYFLYRVDRVLLFGSLLSSAERVGDVDLAIALSSKFVDRAERSAAEDQRVHDAVQSGRCFGNIVEMLIWPRMEVLRFLKSRARGLSFHDPGDAVLQRVETRQIFP